MKKIFNRRMCTCISVLCFTLITGCNGSSATIDTTADTTADTTSDTAAAADTTNDGDTTDDSTGWEYNDVDNTPPTTTATNSIELGSTTSSSSTFDVGCDYNYSAFNSSVTDAGLDSIVSWVCSDTERTMTSNGIPDHEVGEFPNAGNPNAIDNQEDDIVASYTLEPTQAGVATTLGGPSGPQGYVLNGVKIDASTAGGCDDNATSTSECTLVGGGAWSIEALGQTSFNFGTDENNAHVQPGGLYHYHGMPEGFITSRDGDETKVTMIGWAADGFPIYARYGYSDASDPSSAITAMTGSYQLVSSAPTTRPSVDIIPLGTFQQDWEYVVGSGDLDACNGRTGVTPEFPNGIYHYYATDTYPYFQRCVNGTVESAGGGGPGGPPPG